MTFNSVYEMAKAIDILTRVYWYEKDNHGNKKELSKLDTILGKLDKLFKEVNQ